MLTGAHGGYGWLCRGVWCCGVGVEGGREKREGRKEWLKYYRAGHQHGDVNDSGDGDGGGGGKSPR